VSEGNSNTLINVSADSKGLTVIILLIILIGLVMWSMLSAISLRDTIKETKTEVRILQMHIQDQNAILIREGIKKVGDSTTGPTDPDKLEVKGSERDRM
jgi:hypothetical protein